MHPKIYEFAVHVIFLLESLKNFLLINILYQVFFILRFPKNQLPQAPYVLTPTEKHQADQRLNQLRVPLNFGVVPTTLFTKIVGGTKSHTWLQVNTFYLFNGTKHQKFYSKVL